MARQFGQGLMAAHGLGGVELFPTQDELSTGPGSLIRTPFGVHRMARRRYGFVTPDGEPLAATLREQIQHFSNVQAIPKAALAAYGSSVPVRPVEKVSRPPEASTDAVSERIKASVTVLEFVSQYVNLKLTGSTALGLCPFHDDHRPSFGVNDERNYWNCFAGCDGRKGTRCHGPVTAWPSWQPIRIPGWLVWGPEKTQRSSTQS